MPLVRIIQICPGTKVGIWCISESEDFFKKKVDVGRDVHHPHKRLQHLAARYLLTILEPHFPVCNIRLSGSDKPFLPKGPYFFSLAHSGDYAVAVTSKHSKVGIDVEMTGEKVRKVMYKFLNEEERSFLSPQYQSRHLTICWSAKEAIYKWNGKRGVDFKKNIHLQPFPCASEGSLRGVFIKEGHSTSLNLNWLMEKNYCVCWAFAD